MKIEQKKVSLMKDYELSILTFQCDVDVDITVTLIEVVMIRELNILKKPPFDFTTLMEELTSRRPQGLAVPIEDGAWRSLADEKNVHDVMLVGYSTCNPKVQTESRTLNEDIFETIYFNEDIFILKYTATAPGTTRRRRTTWSTTRSATSTSRPSSMSSRSSTPESPLLLLLPPLHLLRAVRARPSAGGGRERGE